MFSVEFGKIYRIFLISSVSELFGSSSRINFSVYALFEKSPFEFVRTLFFYIIADNHNYSSITRTLDKPQLNAAKLENFPFQDLQNVVQSRGDSKSEIKRKEISAQRSALEATVSANKSPKSETSTNGKVPL